MSTTNILDLNNRIDELEKNSGGGGSADSAKRSDIATEFSTETTYTAGNFVYHEGKLYQFNADHSAGAWDSTDVVEANVTDQVVSNASAIAGLTASDVAYDNTDSGLTATEVQGAVDELRQADNIMMSDGVTSVEEALGGLYNGLIKIDTKTGSFTPSTTIPSYTAIEDAVFDDVPGYTIIGIFVASGSPSSVLFGAVSEYNITNGTTHKTLYVPYASRQTTDTNYKVTVVRIKNDVIAS